MNGIINLFKPKGITSHEAVKKMRKTLGIKKIGHTGTLDPNATGVLPLCIGKGTRISEYLLDVEKEYVGELTLGIATDTQDAYGRILKYSSKKVDEESIRLAFESFKGEIEQIPPMYSALKHKGKKLYELARKGQTIERPPRKVNIYDLKIDKILNNKKIIFHVKCSKGTYIRTLCDDIGQFLGTYGYLSYLMRIGVGDFIINDSVSIDYIKRLDKKELNSIICPIDKGLSKMESFIVEGNYYKQLINGALIPINHDVSNCYNFNTPIKVYCKNTFIGVGKIINKDNISFVKMDKVLI
ncbi:tRNA pseudouridine(55) synthase TruB [Schnuerera sp. xch1]|uniref:tRNA pseudouridine(55) synthase TruB n=1 Tax=Schnuerera sp. xch1 TaxID=2874283 RepID=UPI001CBE2728|nr:tRNA pseudouridine(55) synthase TruB [Schnuerera sp. xch1]MBZ2173830.1 tRNA pseudouridine(55) synthase TruB [Schnuerera sp. xch1]